MRKIIEEIGNYIYKGVAPMRTTTDKAKWKISRITVGSGEEVFFETKWAEGETALNKIWDEKETYSYL